MEKNLSKEFRGVVAETKELIVKYVCDADFLSGMDGDDAAANIKMMLLFNRLIDLCGDVFEKQDRLMDKMDKAMDKYLEK